MTSSGINQIAVEKATELLKTLPEGERFTWAFRQRDLMSNVVREGGLDNFLNWPGVHEALYAGYTSKVAIERTAIPLELRWLSVDYEYPKSPGPLSPDGASGTYIKQVRLALLLRRMSGEKWSDINSVYEVGGGYGEMAVVLSRVGFHGAHTVLDLPALHVRREWYLHKPGISTISVAEPKMQSVDVLLAVHSLCEIPVARRIEILNKIHARYYIFSITKHFAGVDNEYWFREWCQSEGLLYSDMFLPISNANQDIIIASRT